MLKLAHLSDPHLPLPAKIEWRDLMNKRATGYISWHRHRRSVHDPRVLDALNDDLQITAPDHTVVTGDLTNLALPIEFDRAINWLDELGSPEQVSVIPGNHDAYIDVPWQHSIGKLSAYMAQSDQKQRTAETSFPFVRKINQTAIVGVSSAVPTRWFSAAGKIGKAQLEKLRNHLHELGEAGFFRVVLIHHPPNVGATRMLKQLRDGAEFRAVIADAGAELVLHGHNHRFDQGEVETPIGNAPVIGVPSASSLPKHGCRPAAYHIYRINPTADGWQIKLDVRQFDRRSKRFIAGANRQFSIRSPIAAAAAA